MKTLGNFIIFTKKLSRFLSTNVHTVFNKKTISDTVIICTTPWSPRFFCREDENLVHDAHAFSIFTTHKKQNFIVYVFATFIISRRTTNTEPILLDIMTNDPFFNKKTVHRLYTSLVLHIIFKSTTRRRKKK
jgi:hypothetical protein